MKLYHIHSNFMQKNVKSIVLHFIEPFANTSMFFLPIGCFFRYTYTNQFYASLSKTYERKTQVFCLNMKFTNRSMFFKHFIFFSSVFFVIGNSVNSKNFDFYFEKSNQIFSRLIYFEMENIKFDKKITMKILSRLISFREEYLETIDLGCNFMIMTGFVVHLSFIVNTLAKRVVEKTKLPTEYDFDKILFYFKSKPEKILLRFFQIFSKLIVFFFILTFDRFLHYKKGTGYSSRYKRKKKIELLLSTAGFVQNLFETEFANKFMKKSFKFLRLKNVFLFLITRLEIHENFFRKSENAFKARKFREVISSFSPAFIKLAQAFASRPDIIGEETAMELQRLQDEMPFFSNRIAFDFIKQELGISPDKVFYQISSFPVAAASLGQVYKGVLKNNIPVAIKIQRPGLDELLSLDIILIRFLTFLAQKTLRIKTDLVAAVDEYAYRLFDELDYRKEASSMIKFKSLYGYMDQIYIPKVFLDCSDRRILVMEWIEGNRVVKSSSEILQEDVFLIEIGMRCLLVQLLEVGFLHCDPHGGNLIKTQEGKLAYIDFGLVSEIPKSIRYFLILSVLHLINQEYVLLAKDFAGLSLIRNDDLDKEISNLSSFLSNVFGNSLLNFDNFTFQNMTDSFFQSTVEFSFTLPPYFLNNLRAIATLEGVALFADPNFRIASVIYPYIVNKLLTNSSFQFGAALENFLIGNEALRIRWDRLGALLENPEWNETFLNRRENLPDALLSFVIFPTGAFLKKIIFRNLLNITWEVFLCSFSWKTPRKPVKFNLNKKKNIVYLNEKTIDFREYSRKNQILLLIFSESKIYSLKALFFFSKMFFFSMALMFVELLIRSLHFITVSKKKEKGSFDKREEKKKHFSLIKKIRMI